ncbi:MAG: alpha/beta fold hydrolase [Rudaea sp.]
METAGGRTIKLRDGRAIGFAEYGNPRGRPILHMHGFPSSRFEGGHQALVEIACRLNARVFVIERPGIGNSDFRVLRSVADWPATVAEFADAVGLDHFILMGASAGGVYALACAEGLPRRTLAVGIISGLGPLDVPGSMDGMTPALRLLSTAACRVPRSVPRLLAMLGSVAHAAPDLYNRVLAAGLSASDRAVLDRPGARSMFNAMLSGALQAGSRGVAQDLKLLCESWKLKLGEIPVPVFLWHGEADRIVPPSHARYLASAIPPSRVQFFSNEGHLSLILCHWGEILSDLLG